MREWQQYHVKCITISSSGAQKDAPTEEQRYLQDD